MTNVAPESLLTPGTTYRLPEIVCSSPSRVNPDYPTIYERNAAWVRELMPFPDDTALGILLENRTALWDSLVYPIGLAERVFHSSCVTSLMFEVDDLALLERGLFDEVAADWMAGHPYGGAFTDIWRILRDRMPSGVYQRYRTDWQDWFNYTLKENEYRARREVPDLDTYLDIRRVSVGLRPYVVTIEYVLDLDLTQLFADDPDMYEAKLLTVDHGMLVNDLLSYRWECFKGDYFNTISPLLHVHGRTLQQAVDDTVDRVRQADQDLTRLCDRLRRRYALHPQGAQLATYFNALGAFCAGNLRWSFETSRYNGRGYGWNGLRTGTVTLDSKATFIAPD